MLAALVFIACSAYTPTTTHHLAAPAATTANAAQASQMFYWFMEPGDILNDYANLSYEIAELEMIVGGLVNTDQTGGICLELGYAFPTLPHTMGAQVGLYLHL